ncbi:benzoate 4-monooxygenase cytochrome P450 [Xylariaceae sp. FL1651]|nr:benzoate 4-monooxygenase cytochrome P450 [Xylariaceae sp. FL1651]
MSFSDNEVKRSPGRVLLMLFCLWVVFFTAQVIYRLFFHPLSKFPGSKLAAGTFLYEGYYDVVKRGKYVHEIEEMHRRYGPIIRINPQELHVYDPSFFDTIYSGKGKWEKPPFMVRSIDLGMSTFGTLDHDVHRLRRSSLNRFFSKQKVNALQSVIQDLANKLCDKLESYCNTGTPIDFECAFSDFTLDAIAEYIVDSKLGLVERKELDNLFRKTFRGLGEFGHLVKIAPWLMTVFNNLPKWLVIATNPNIKLLLDWDDTCLEIANKLLCSDPDEAKEHPTVMREIIADPDLGPSEKTPVRLMYEAKTTLNAGTGTTSWALTTAVWYLTTNPDMLARLRAEIRSVMPDPRRPVKVQMLEQLPYFTAVLRETLRLGFGAPMRSARAAPDRVLQYKEWTIPQGTPVSMSISHMHLNPEVFPGPMRFDPERWLGDIEERHRLERHFVPFSRGTRNCLGPNLAWAEMYIMLSQCLSRMDLEPFETTNEHIEFYSDMFLAEPKYWKDGPRFLVKNVITH